MGFKKIISRLEKRFVGVASLQAEFRYTGNLICDLRGIKFLLHTKSRIILTVNPAWGTFLRTHRIASDHVFPRAGNLSPDLEPLNYF